MVLSLLPLPPVSPYIPSLNINFSEDTNSHEFKQVVSREVWVVTQDNIPIEIKDCLNLVAHPHLNFPEMAGG